MKGLISINAIFSGDWFILWFSIFVISIPLIFGVLIKIFTDKSMIECIRYGEKIFGSLLVIFLIFILAKTL